MYVLILQRCTEYLVPVLIKMLAGTGYRNRRVYCQYNDIRA